ncbi:MAG: DUF4384 domain-containing protein [Blastocatellia bacterium]|nr:DUF4384 domain-containing protein [Blastocatellia bacterium]
MKQKLFERLMPVLLSFGLILIPISANAQSDSPTLVWSRKNEKKAAPPVKRRKVVRGKPLELEIRVFKQGARGESIETNPFSTYFSGDQIRFGITSNQDGYLYLLNQTRSPDGRQLAPLSVTFPDSRVDYGRNFVTANQEYFLPGFVQAYSDPRDGWFAFEEPNAEEIFTVIFTKDLIPDLLSGKERIDQGTLLERVERRGGTVIHSALKRKSNNPYTIVLTNAEAKNRDELIDSITLRCAEMPALSARKP